MARGYTDDDVRVMKIMYRWRVYRVHGWRVGGRKGGSEKFASNGAHPAAISRFSLRWANWKYFPPHATQIRYTLIRRCCHHHHHHPPYCNHQHPPPCHLRLALNTVLWMTLIVSPLSPSTLSLSLSLSLARAKANLACPLPIDTSVNAKAKPRVTRL